MLKGGVKEMSGKTRREAKLGGALYSSIQALLIPLDEHTV